MKSGKLKKLRKRIGWVLLIGFVFFVGVSIGAESSSSSYVERVVFVDREDAFIRDIEQQIVRQEQVVEEIVENVVVEIPEIPDIPEILEIPAMPVVHHVNHGPSFFQVVSSIANLLVAIFLIAIGVKVLFKQRHQPVEKQPK
jgi:hypothetical protein